MSTTKDVLDERFDIDAGQIRSGTIRGGASTGVGQIGRLVLQFGSTAILARLLDPSDYGLFAMAATATGFVAMFNDSGLSMATVQKQKINHGEVTSLFWLNGIIGLALTLVSIAISPLIAAFYQRTELTLIVSVISLNFVIGAFGIQHLALLRRRMKFGVIAFNGLLSFGLGIVTAVTCAWFGCQYWSLVMMQLASNVSLSALSWRSSGWLPGRPGIATGVQSMAKFGAFLTAAKLMAYIRRNIDNVMIGKLYSEDALGVYSKAYSLLLLPLQQATRPFTAIVIPAMSRLVDQPVKYRNLYRKSVLLLTCCSLPLAVFSIVSPDSIVYTLLSSKWSSVVPLFVAFAPAAIAGSMNGVSSWVFLSQGRADRHFRAQILATVLVLTGILVGAGYGVQGIAWGFSCSYSAAVPIVLLLSIKGTPLTWRDIAGNIWMPTFACIIATIACLAARSLSFVDTLSFQGLLVSALSFFVTYAVVLISLPCRKVILEVVRGLRNRKPLSANREEPKDQVLGNQND